MPDHRKNEGKYETNAQRQAAYRLRSLQARDQQLAQKSLPRLPAIPSMPGEARWAMALRHAYTLMETTATKMQEYYDCRSEQWQESEKAEIFEERLQSLVELVSELQDLTGAEPGGKTHKAIGLGAADPTQVNLDSQE
jgi:hypothetical protein